MGRFCVACGAYLGPYAIANGLYCRKDANKGVEYAEKKRRKFRDIQTKP